MGLMFQVAEPWYSLENFFLNYLIYASIVGILAIVLAFAAHKIEGLGPVVGGFFSVSKAKVQDAMTLVEDSVDAMNTEVLGPEKREDMDTLMNSSVLTHEVKENTTVMDAKAGVAAAKFAAKAKGAQAHPQSMDATDIAYLKQLLKKYKADDSKAWAYLGFTALYAVGGLVLMHMKPTWWTVMLAGGVNVRMFIVFHDACHNSFFLKSHMNRRLAILLSPIIGQNASDWTRSHNHHHRHLGRADITDFSLTVWFSEKEYHSMTPLLKFAYRVIRDPLVLPNLLSWFIFWVFPIVKDPVKTITTRGCFYVPIWMLFGSKTALLYVLTTWIGGVVGIQLFHLQHQCNSPYRVAPSAHSKWDAGMLGSTHLLVPWPVTLMTAGIEFHHIHHASTQVPCYNLAKCHAEGEKHRRDGLRGGLWKRAGVNRIGFKRAFLSLFHTLFEGDIKFTDVQAHSVVPRFRSFDIYRWLGLEDVN